MDALTAVMTRHSVAAAFLMDPAPAGEVLERILAAGASAPDHGRLRPWRFIVIRDEARARLGEVFVEALRRRDPDAPDDAIAKERERPQRAPMLVAVAARVDPAHPKIPAIEQILSAGAAVQNMLLAAHALGFGAKWVTGNNAYDDHVRAALGLDPDDRIAGFVYLGTVDGQPPKVPRAEAGAFTHDWEAPVT